MLSLLRKLHRWQLVTVFKENEWRFPLRRGYRAFDLALQASAEKISKRDLLFIYGPSRLPRPFGYWDDSVVFLRLAYPIVSSITLFGAMFGSVTASQFKGVIDYSSGVPNLIGAYRVFGFPRWMINILIYLPFFVIFYAVLDAPFVIVQHFADGGVQEATKEAIVIFLVCAFVWMFWGIGFLLARFHLASTVRERDQIYRLLEEASR